MDDHAGSSSSPSDRPSPSSTSQSASDGASSSRSPADMATFDSESVMAMIRRRRAGNQPMNPQARIYKKARMRSRNWSELRQRANHQPADDDMLPPNGIQPDPLAVQPQTPVLTPNAPTIVAQTPATSPNDGTLPVAAAATVSAPAHYDATSPTLSAAPTPLPRDHLLLLVPTTPDLVAHSTSPHDPS